MSCNLLLLMNYGLSLNHLLLSLLLIRNLTYLTVCNHDFDALINDIFYSFLLLQPEIQNFIHFKIHHIWLRP